MSGRVLGLECPSFIVDSRYRDSGEVSNFVHEFPVRNNHMFNNVAMISCRIPKSYYLAQSNNGIMSFSIDENGVSRTITIAEGNYSFESFRSVLEGLLNIGGWGYIVTFPDDATEPQTSKYTFTVSGNAGIQPIITMTTSSKRIDELLGFVDSSVNTFVADKLTSTYPVRFEYTSYITVRSNISRNGGASSEDTSVLARIPVGNVSPFDYIEYTMINLEDSTRVMTNTNNNAFSFGIYDDRDELINLNGHNWSCTVLLYEYNNASDLSINDLRLKYLSNPYEEAILTEGARDQSQIKITKEEEGAQIKAKQMLKDRAEQAKVRAHHEAIKR